MIAPEDFSAYEGDDTRPTLVGNRAVVRNKTTREPRGTARTVAMARALDENAGEEWVLLGPVRELRYGEQLRNCWACAVHETGPQ